MRNFLLILLIAISKQLLAQDLSIGLFSELSPSNYVVTIQQGTYRVKCDSMVFDTITVNQNVSIQLESGLITCTIGDSVYQSKGNLLFEGNTDASFFINCVGLNTSVRCYKGNLSFVVNNSCLRAINIIDIEDYVAAVVEAEAGYKHNVEYYKTQAVICRTYAISHIDRHKDEAYDLCDNVHCQMYPYKSMNAGIRNAIQTTEGMILVDSAYMPIIAAYHYVRFTIQ
jgi:stage II sporulation protein D